MAKQTLIIDLRHQIHWRHRYLSEICTLLLWLGAILILAPHWNAGGERGAAGTTVFSAVSKTSEASAASSLIPHTVARIPYVGAGLPRAIQARGWLSRSIGHVGQFVAMKPHIVGGGSKFVVASPFAALLHYWSVLTFAAAILGFAGVLWLWSRLSAAERKPQHLDRLDHARHHKLCAVSLDLARKSQVCIVHHNDHGQIVAISPQRTPVDSSDVTIAA